METTKTTIGDHGRLVLEMYYAGEKQADILRRLETLGVKTSRQNLSVWIARRLARIQERAPTAVSAPVQIPQEPPHQVQPQPVVTPQKMAAAPSAVPASGATTLEGGDTPDFNKGGQTGNESPIAPGGRPMFGRRSTEEDPVIKAALDKARTTKRVGAL